MIEKSKKVKFLSALIIISIIIPTILFSKPKKAKAFPVFDIPNTAISAFNAVKNVVSAGADVIIKNIAIKNFAKDISKEILKRAARRFLQEITTSTINWINSGYSGRPLFLENSESFFRDIAKSEIRNFVTTIGYDPLKFPFGRQTALQAINAYKRQFEINAQYSLSRVINDPLLLQRYRNNFNVGGWNGFLINTQYPQNNYLGFQLLASEQLSLQLAETSQNAAERVRNVLQQSSGFLSPLSCPDKPSYNNGINEFNRPSFNYDAPYNLPFPSAEDPESPEWIANEDYDRQWQERKETARATWAEENTCPGGLVVTTPGSVAANSIMEALGTTQRQGELSAALGNSLSAIFDALIDDLMNRGLTSLATKISPRPTSVEWSYEGATLGSPGEGGVNIAWNVGPDEEIILKDFKKQLSGRTIVSDDNGVILEDYIGNTIGDPENVPGNEEYIPGDIANTEEEIKLMYNASITEPGIAQMLSLIWPQIRELDICIPGPNVNWEKRTTDDLNRDSKKLQEKASEDNEKAALADLIYKELLFAVSFFKDWINNKMLTELPNSILYMDAVGELESLSYQSDELTTKKRKKGQALARIQAIRVALEDFTSQPNPGSAEEKTLISLKKQYNATKDVISNTFSIEDTRNELTIAIEKLDNLNTLTAKCEVERTGKGWTNPGGRDSTFLNEGTEQNIFCDLPIIGGYSHETFVNKGEITHPEIPLINAENVLNWRGRFGIFGHSISVNLSCNTIYRANILDYKGTIPGVTIVTEPYQQLPNDTGIPYGEGELGYCTYSNVEIDEDLIYANVMTREDCGVKDGSWIVPE